MKPVDQTLFPMWDANGQQTVIGNCFQAAVASLLELSLHEVPHFCATSGWRKAARDWAESRGFFYDEHEIGHAIDGALCIKSGTSPRTDPTGKPLRHAVVAKGAEVVFDPHPSRAGLIEDGREEYGYFLRLNPVGGAS